MCRLNLLLFLQWYFPHSTGLGLLSPDHVQFIDDLQEAILTGGRIAKAVFRGFAKTTIGELACIWSQLYGHRKFIILVGADADAAKQNLESVKTELEGNERLAEDFPEVCYPIEALQGRPQRCATQTVNGELTHIAWTAERVVFPTIGNHPSNGACIMTSGFLSVNRGLKHKLTDGRQVRPDFVFIDDPQTDQSASTPGQVQKREAKLAKTILPLSGHMSNLAVYVAGTIINKDDFMYRLTDPNESPGWRGSRVKMVKKFPDALETLWLDRYAKIRTTFDREDPNDQQRARDAATAFYVDNREAMDAGAEVAWRECYSRQAGEVSAIQHAINLLIDNGAEAFASECQNEPLEARSDLKLLTNREICEKTSHLGRGVVPAEATKLTAFVDVQGSVLYWGVMAWSPTGTGWVIDYGTWPEQSDTYFRLSGIRKTLQRKYPGQTGEAIITSGLVDLFRSRLGLEWTREGGGAMRLAAAAVDSGWSKTTVEAFCRGAREGFEIWPYKGVGIKAARRQMDEWTQPEQFGDGWAVTRPNRGHRLLHADVNLWKRRAHEALALPPGTTGAAYLFDAKNPANVHRMVADHFLSEVPKKTECDGRVVYEWHLKTGEDNHAFDWLVGNFVLASLVGIQRPGVTLLKKGRRRGRVRRIG